MAGKKSKRAARAVLATRNWKKNQSLREQVREARDAGKLTQSQKTVSDTDAYEENKQKATQERKHRHIKKEDFTWSNRQATRTVSKMKRDRNKINFTWSEGDMAKAGRNLWGIPKDGVCMILSNPCENGYVQVLYNGMPHSLRAHCLRPVGWVEEEDEED